MDTLTTKPVILTPRDEEILATVYQYRFVTSLDIAHLLFRPTYISYVNSRLARLAGKKDLEENTFLCRFKLPDMEGNRERVFTLGTRGREFARETLGKPVDWFFRPNKLKFFSYSAILHHLLVTRFIAAATWLCRSRGDLSLLQERLSYEVSVQVVKTWITPQHATAEGLREARTEPRRHARQLRMPL